MGLGLSATTIKSWFQYRCERKTRYELMDQADRDAVPVTQDDREKPWAEFGVDYEKRVLARLARGSRLIQPAANEEGLSERLALAFLRGAQAAQYASQVNLKPKSVPALLKGAPNVRMRRTFADLVRSDRSADIPVFRVIDVKATRAATAFHKTQVAFYARLLEIMLKEVGLNGRVDELGSIWRIPHTAP
jgi:predicted RecB family nuclease